MSRPYEEVLNLEERRQNPEAHDSLLPGAPAEESGAEILQGTERRKEAGAVREECLREGPLRRGSVEVDDAGEGRALGRLPGSRVARAVGTLHCTQLFPGLILSPSLFVA